MQGLKKLVATAATLAMVSYPLVAGGAAFAQTGTSSTGSSSTSTTTSTSSSTSSTTPSTTTTTPSTGSSSTSSTTTGSSSSSTSGVGYKVVGFSDVNSSTPHYASIEELAALGLVAGFPNGTYEPTQNVTRAQFAKLIDIAMGLQDAANGDTGSSEFTDVPGGQWYTGYVNVAAAKGIVNGFPDGTFQPNADVQYDQAVTMVVRALGYEPDVVGTYPSGYMAEATNIQNSAAQYTLLSGLTDQLSQAMDRADVARLVDNMLNAVPASTQTQLTTGNRQVTTSSPTVRTEAAQLGYTIYFPGNAQSSPPLADCYGNVVTGTILTNPALNANQVQITSLSGGSCGSSPVVGTTANTYTLAPTVALVGGTNLLDMTGYQVAFATNNQGQIVFIGAVTPSNDVLSNALLGSQLTVSDVNGVGQIQSGISQISIEPTGGTAYQNYDIAAGMVAVPDTGIFKGSNGTNDTVTAILNPNGDVVSLIDDSNLTQYKDVYLTGMTTLNGTQALAFLDGSLTSTSLGIGAGAVVTLDGKPATLSDLKTGMILNIAVNGQSQATSIAASDQTVTGTITNITTQTTGNVYMTVNGTQYEVRETPNEAIYAEQGATVGAVSPDTLSGLTNNTATIYLGVDNHVGFINVTNANTIVGMALNNGTGANPVLEVESGSGGVTAYPLAEAYANIKPGDIVRLTLNAANGDATVVDYSENDTTGNVTFGDVSSPALVKGVLGNEIQFEANGNTYDEYVPNNTPIFEGTGGGAYQVSNLVTAETGSIAPTASTTTLSSIQPGYYVTLGGTSSGLVKGILYLSGETTCATDPTAMPDPCSVTSVSNTVDVAVVSAGVASSGQLGTAEVAPSGATTPVQVSVESNNNGNTALGTDAGTNNSITTLTMIGGSLVQSVAESNGTLTATDLTPSSQVTFQSLTADSSGGPAFSDTAGNIYDYGSSTVVLNIPDDQIEPIGSLIPGQTLIVYTQTLPGEASDSGFAQFVEVVNTATNIGTTTSGSSSVTVNATNTGTTMTVSGHVYAEWAVSGTVPAGSTTVLVAAGGNGLVSASYVASNGSLPGASSASVTPTVTSTGTGYSAFVFVPEESPAVSTTLTVSAFGGTSSGQGTGTISD